VAAAELEIAAIWIAWKGGQISRVCTSVLHQHSIPAGTQIGGCAVSLRTQDSHSP
jgi:hypothetical protein